MDSKKPESERLAHAWIFVDMAVRRFELTYFGCGLVVVDGTYFVTWPASSVVESTADVAECLWWVTPCSVEGMQGIEWPRVKIVAKEV